MKNFTVIIILTLFTNCNQQQEVEETIIEVSSSDGDILKANDNPKDYFSEDGNVSITFYDNGNLKDIVVVSDKYNLPYDTAALAAGQSTGGVMYIDQRISYNEDQTLNLVSINADTNSTFWYSAHDGISICYDCDSISYWN